MKVLLVVQGIAYHPVTPAGRKTMQENPCRIKLYRHYCMCNGQRLFQTTSTTNCGAQPAENKIIVN